MSILVATDGPLAEIVKASLCDVCLDSGLTLNKGAVIRCPLCIAEDKTFSAPAVRLAVCIWEMQDKGRVADAPLFILARFLTRTTPAQPLKLDDLAGHFRSDKRTVKGWARTLRRHWLLPIGSSRQEPHGLYWCHTERDYLDWERTYRGQALDELATLYRLRRRNYPELAGQQSLFVEQVKQELEEAIR
jgi:hypothetical protein